MKRAEEGEGRRDSGLYAIRIKGHLDGRWADWFGGMTIALEANGDTVISGPIVDQAALHGVLRKVCGLGVPLLSVNPIQGKGKRVRTDRRAAIAAGALYIVGTVSGVFSLLLTAPVREAQDALIGVASGGTPIILSALAVLTMGLALAMVPVVMYPVLRKQNEGLALGYVVLRGGLETIFPLATAAGWLLLLPLSQAYRVGAPDAASLLSIGALLLDAKEIGSIGSIVFCLGASVFYVLLYRSRLVPRWLSVWGLLAVIPYITGVVLSLARLLDPVSTAATVLDIPMAVQEMVLAVWLIAKGFSPAAIAAQPAGKV